MRAPFDADFVGRKICFNADFEYSGSEKPSPQNMSIKLN